MAIVQTRTPKERKPGPEPAGRTCSEPGCETRLSTYNCGSTCSLHNGWPTNEELAQLHDVQVARLEYGMAA